MRVVLTPPQRCDATPDGAVWVKSDHAYEYWTRFLDVFDSVRLVCRVQDVPSVPPGMHRVNGEGVTVAPVPYYIGPWQYYTRRREVWSAARNSVEPGDAVILFGDSVSVAIQSHLARTGYPYAMYVRGDPYDVCAPGAMKHPLRPLLRWWSPRVLRGLCAQACAAEYVTARALQRRYPCPSHMVGISEVELPRDAWAPAPRPPRPDSTSFTVIIVGTLAQLYKAPDVLIEAVASCIRQGMDLSLVLVGDGQHRPQLEALAGRFGISDRVRFRGELPSGQAVRAELDRADLFVLASHQEGLPRAMVEAMARALPVIGSTVGGIPELLPAEDMVRPGDPAALAAKIREVLSDPERMARMSARNLETATYYREENHRRQWVDFCRYLRERTEEWLQSTGRQSLYI